MCGIEKSAGSLIVFVDDDNILANDYLMEAIGIGKQYEFLGSWGSGMIVPEFEERPADHLKVFIPFLAIRSNDFPHWGNVITQNDSTPVGAGMCVRRKVALRYVEFYKSDPLKLTDRRGTSMVSGGDNEIAYVGCASGFGMGTFPSLRLIHVIPKERVTDDYFLRLLEGTTFTHSILDFKWKTFARELGG